MIALARKSLNAGCNIVAFLGHFLAIGTLWAIMMALLVGAASLLEARP